MCVFPFPSPSRIILIIVRSYFIQDGAVLESGSHDQLLAHRGAYYEFVQLQQLSRAA
jgi:ABC-type multidrug transport system fused ATPase/permease subunit